jgi:hypothetical protein
MEYMLFMLGVMVPFYLLLTLYMHRKAGVQPNLVSHLMVAVCIGCGLLAYFGLRRLGVDVKGGHAREIFFLGLGIFWLVLAVRMAEERKSSGAVLMDLGRTPLFGLYLALAVCMVALGIGYAIHPGSPVQAFAHLSWAAWFLVMARGRFQVRDRGIITGSVLPWKRVAGCIAERENKVRLSLNKGLQRVLEFKVPADRRAEFIELVSHRMAG